MKQKKSYWKIPLILLGIFLIMAFYYSYKDSNKNKITFESQKEKSSPDNNEHYLKLNSYSWSVGYFYKSNLKNMYIDRYGNTPLMVRWKSDSYPYWKEGTWIKNKKPSFYGIRDMIVVEFKLYPNTKNKTIRVYQKK